ncbi:MAG TPA: tetratricopeptide repeat protein [Thermoanaerobaculia bacterium]|nr:tetratricopeptide repeat protein [Thermoanaerobaculia bacterium]
MVKPTQLPDELYERITALTSAANEKFEAGEYGEALADYTRALALIPEPLEDWEASTWTLTAIGDCLFLMGDFAAAHPYLERALGCPDIAGSEFLILRVGQVRFEIGDHEGARGALSDAWRLGGRALFEGEDPKYRKFLKAG